MPWQSAEELNPFRFATHLQAFATIVLPILFVGASCFFVSGALSRKLIVVYTQGIFFFVLFMLTKSIENQLIQSLLDPFSLVTLTDMVEGWTNAERNHQLIPFNSFLLYNKLFWIGIGVLVFAIGYHRFNFNVIQGDKQRKQEKKEKREVVQADVFQQEIPDYKPSRGALALFSQLMSHAYFHFAAIMNTMSFWAIVISGAIIILINSISLGTVYGVDSYPKTYFIVAELQEMSLYFFIIILIFYAGELIWKERDAKINLIYDATPISDLVNISGKFLGFQGVFIVLMCTLMLSGVLFQLANGYYQFELGVYFSGFFLEVFPFIMLYTFVAFFLQVVVNQKFVAIILVLVFFILNVVSEFFGFEHDLYKFAGNTLGTYSEMNGYGHALAPYLWVKAYWTVFGVLLLIATSLFVVRGTENRLKKRWELSKQRMSKPVLRLGSVILLVFVLIGTNIFYNTNVLNTYWSHQDEQSFRAAYEQTLKKFEYVAQPKIVAVNLEVELYPSKRGYQAIGTYQLINHHDHPIETIHLQKRIDPQLHLTTVELDRASIVDRQYENYGYFLYHLKEPLMPRDSILLHFEQSYEPIGFEERTSNTNIVENGTFFDNQEFPTIGYNKKYELRNKADRYDFGLPERSGMAAQTDQQELVNARTGDDGYKIDFEIVLGTDNDQIAVAPGQLKREWKEDGRNYFHYQSNEPMVNFYSIVSARYQVKKDTWHSKSDDSAKPVALEIYYHKGHEGNLDRMMESMKWSLDYFTTNFGPYPYEQVRIMEFPRYENFAQSFPNTIPFSEGMGFVLDIDDEQDVDMVFYITAHELAHQWWGLQVVAANVQGRSMVLESLAQYSAIMVLKQKYGLEKVHQFLKMEQEAYFEERVKEKKGELPLSLVEHQDYIYYDKAVVNLYTFQDHISEERVNRALRDFVKDWNALDSSFAQARYATSEDLLTYLRNETPDSLQYLIHDLFETVTCYENELLKASSTPLTDGTYQVDIEFKASKYEMGQDGNRNYGKQPIVEGEEKSLPLTDYIELGVFGEEGQELYLQKHQVTKITNNLRLIVNQKPLEVGLDPYRKLIDTSADRRRVKL